MCLFVFLRIKMRSNFKAALISTKNCIIRGPPVLGFQLHYYTYILTKWKQARQGPYCCLILNLGFVEMLDSVFLHLVVFYSWQKLIWQQIIPMEIWCGTLGNRSLKERVLIKERISLSSHMLTLMTRREEGRKKNSRQTKKILSSTPSTTFFLKKWRLIS